MIRYESEDGKVFVRYDGTETRVDVRRGREGDGLKMDELQSLISVLTDALVERRAFEKEVQHRALLSKKGRKAVRKERKRLKSG